MSSLLQFSNCPVSFTQMGKEGRGRGLGGKELLATFLKPALRARWLGECVANKQLQKKPPK